MPKRKEILTEKIRPYHILGKAVEGREIFDREEDRARFVFQMYAANIGKPVINLYRKDIFQISNAILQGEEIPKGYVIQEHDPLVHLFSFILDKDRYNLGLVPAKNKRTGTLFEGRFKAAPIVNPKQLESVVKYINIKRILDRYKNEDLLIYPYSSFPDLFGTRTSHLLSQESRATLLKILSQEFFVDREDYTSYVKDLNEEGRSLFLDAA